MRDATIDFPTPDEVAEALTLIRDTLPNDPTQDGWIEVRLQVMEGGDWSLHTGDPQADNDHGGFWGADHINYRADCRAAAHIMLEEARDQYLHPRGVTMDWLEHVEKWKDCQRCPLAQQRGLICLARGTLPCEVLFVGEAPGLNEDAGGEPFIGPAGQRLDQIIERALLNSVSYAMTNLVACFPREAKARGENEPERSEILGCRPRLYEFINLGQPKLIVCVGNLTTQYVPTSSTVHRVDIVHPAHILRMPYAQQGFATQKCIVQIRRAYEDAVQAPKQFQPWETEHANPKKRQATRLSARKPAARPDPDTPPW